MARQVNHDVRNGLTPLRNVIRHLAEVDLFDGHRFLGDVFAADGFGGQFLNALRTVRKFLEDEGEEF